MEEQKRHENLTYLALWGMLFAVPVLSLYLRSVNNPAFDFEWKEVFMIWKQFGIYLGIFLIHHLFLAPLLVYKQRRALYFSIVAVIIGGFIVYQCSNRPSERRAFNHELPPHEQLEPSHRQHPPHPHDFKEHRRHRPPVMVGQHDIIALIILILMLGMNIGIKLYFKSRKDAKELVELEKKSLEQQLEYLKYQINPHFFMNTLNNIHALVDIDAEKAKHTIVELSKMMRFVLYEGNKKGVPLDREIAFIQHYITLMKLRYTDKVSITVSTPEQMPNKEIPPLLLITFIENAFKHGVSYQQESYINIAIKVEGDNLHFSCNNSKQAIQEQRPGGVGLTNVKQRLALIYDHNYTLTIKDEADAYHVELTIPLLNDQSTGY